MERLFLSFSAAKLRQLESRIQDCLKLLSEEEVWWRASEENNSVGNLVLHLSGNIGQWVVAPLMQRDSLRDRDSEFAARGNATVVELGYRIAATIDEAVTAIENADPKRLTERVRIQRFEVSILEAIYHAVEHFAMHTGQIIYVTKSLRKKDLAFYKHVGTANHVDSTP